MITRLRLFIALAIFASLITIMIISFNLDSGKDITIELNLFRNTRHYENLVLPSVQLEPEVTSQNVSGPILSKEVQFRNPLQLLSLGEATSPVIETIPAIEPQKPCRDILCSEYLSKTEKYEFDLCERKTRAAEKAFGPILNGTCHFMNGTGRSPVALLSYPGSGNTWVRGLLEKVTGICTGALYCDHGLRTKGFTGEGIKGSSTIVVKSHQPGANFIGPKMRKEAPHFGAAIFLVRNLRNALVAEWHRERSNIRTTKVTNNHYLYVGPEYFGNYKEWNDYLHLKAPRWKRQVTGWLPSARDHPMLVVRYEDLKSDTLNEVKKMLDFLHFPYKEEEIAEKLNEGFNDFYRNHTDTFEHFTPEQNLFIRSLVNESIVFLEKRGVADLFPMHEYL